MNRALAALGLAVTLCALPSQADAARSAAAVAAFKRGHPCPVNDARRGPCPGYQVDHVVPLCVGGPDSPDNMQWLTVQAHKQKTRFDVMRCRTAKRAQMLQGQ